MITRTIFVAALLSLCGRAAAVPTAEVQVSVTVGTTTVTLYGDDDPAKKVLYFLPSRVVLQKADNIPLFSLLLYRRFPIAGAAKYVGTEALSILDGGVVDAIVKVDGPVEDLAALKGAIAQQAPDYKDHHLAQIPLEPGSGNVVFTHNALQAVTPPAVPSDRQGILGSITSGGPVSTELAGGFMFRARLSELDASLLAEALPKNGFTAEFDVLFSAKAKILLPKDSVTVEARQRQIYHKVDEHFRARGGYWWWSVSTDIRSISESLVKSGDLKISISARSGKATPETLQSLADTFVRDFVMKSFVAPLTPPNVQAAADASGGGWFAWARAGYSRVDVDQLTDQLVKVDYSAQQVAEFPVFARAEIKDLKQVNVVYVDFNKTYFARQPFLMTALPRDVVDSPEYSGAVATFDVESEAGAARRISVSLARADEYKTTWMPARSSNGRVVTPVKFRVTVNRPGQAPVTSPQFDYTNNDNLADPPHVDLATSIGYKLLRVDPAVFTANPDVRLVRVTVPTHGAATPQVYEFDRSETTHALFYPDPRDPPGSCKVAVVSSSKTVEFDRILPSQYRVQIRVTPD